MTTRGNDFPVETGFHRREIVNKPITTPSYRSNHENTVCTPKERETSLRRIDLAAPPRPNRPSR
jgi:hypothetical protein